MKPRELLLAACLLCAVVAMIALVRAAEWTAAHWVLVAVLVMVLAALALVLHNQQQLEVINERHAVWVGRWRRVKHHRPWPKACRDCGITAHDWKSLRAHDDPDTSPCARYLVHRDATGAAEVLSMEGWQADVLGGTESPREQAREALE